MNDVKQVKKQVEKYEKDILKQIAVFLFNKRKAKNVTIKDLNIMTGVGTAVISDLENAKSMPRIETLLRICEVLEVSTSELFDCMKIGIVKNDNCSSDVIDTPKINNHDRLSSLLAEMDYSKEDIANVVSYVRFLEFNKQVK